MATDPVPQKPSRLRWLVEFVAAHPYFTVIAGAASILSFFTGFWFYYASQQRPRLVYWVNPTRALVVDKSQAGELRVFHGDREIQGDISIATVFVWNAGNAPIRREAVLQELRLQISPPRSILVARLSQTARPACQLAVIPSKDNQGSVALAFRILEEGDGGVVQIQYEGSGKDQVALVGAVEGQRAPEGLPLLGRTRLGQAVQSALGFVGLLFMFFIVCYPIIAAAVWALERLGASNRVTNAVAGIFMSAFIMFTLFLAYFAVRMTTLPLEPEFAVQADKP